MLLAQQYQCPARAVDASDVFIAELKVRAKQAGLDQLIIPICGDMAALDWPAGSVDLLWSEGAAYNLGFERALRTWRSLLADGGMAVISELSWFTDHLPEPAIAYWQSAYPGMGSEAENVERAKRSGFRVKSTHRLPSQAWWTNYYDPLRVRMQQMKITPMAQAVIQETKAEMALFEQFSDAYGYTFYVLQAVSVPILLN